MTTDIKAALDKIAPAVEQLACHQQQADADGVMVTVSRQALDEVLAALASLSTSQGDAPVAWTNEAQLGFLKDPTYAEIPMAMWQKRKSFVSDIPLYASPQPAPAFGEGVEIKPLVWRDHRPDSFPEPAWSAQTPFGFYHIEEVGSCDVPFYVVRLHAHHFIAEKEGLPEAKAAAQKDFEQRILSSLRAPEAGESDLAIFNRIIASLQYQPGVNGDENSLTVGEIRRAL